ncbi:uncharacterized protein LOC128724325 [Anopheles nili]|uniref:uncharacterized protein LOC128724325 n=1 Tax=Anopheles nili TaxID=185578 RepID=UPI00237ACF72|nr:uncharacterized protein LOC128724325 [Anopheles nili]
MLKWVVTRGPQTMCSEWQSPVKHPWIWNEENPHSKQQLDLKNNNTIHHNMPVGGSSTPVERIGFMSDCTDLSNLKWSSPTPNVEASDAGSAFCYLLVNRHSSPLKRLSHATGNNRHCTTAQHNLNGQRRVPQKSRRRFSSLHIREPTKLASPSYRSADDPANDLSSEQLMPASPNMFATESEPYNEREIKTPETEKMPLTSHGCRQLVSRRAVRRRKIIRSSTKDV